MVETPLIFQWQDFDQLKRIHCQPSLYSWISHFDAKNVIKKPERARELWATGTCPIWTPSTIDKSRVVILPESNYIVVSLKLHDAPWSRMKGDLQKRQIPEQVITCWCRSKLQILLIQEIFRTVLGPLHRDGNQITDMMFTLMPFTMITNREYWAWKKEKTNEKRRMPKLTWH